MAYTGILTKDITYRCYTTKLVSQKEKSMEVIGFDTESYDNGECFMLCTSLGDVFTLAEMPACLFNRQYRGTNFVCYNLAYDEGSIIQFLPRKNLNQLWHDGKTSWNGYIVKCIPKKMLSISKDRHSVKFYDMLNFFGGSLDYNAKKYLGEEKIEVGTKTFSRKYVKENWKKLGEYCIQDSILVKKLADIIIGKFEKFGVYPTKLYSTAYISYTYFRKKTNYITVNRFWKEDKKLLDYALMAYNGGKFEVTEKGTGYFYEYDIVSAYPYEIANLLDISYAKIVWDDKYIKEADYGFLNCQIDISIESYSSIALKKHGVNVYPVGSFEKVITKREYEYLLSCGCVVSIINAVYILCSHKIYPYREEIRRLVKLKQEFKRNHNDLDTHTIKIFLNSLYGKFCQIIKTRTSNTASTCWNPIYASIITANTRLRVTELQQKHPEIIAVHTDSVISKKKLNFGISDNLGDFSFQEEGQGVMLGTGIYQIGNKTKFRGFESKTPLSDMINVHNQFIDINSIRKYGWREVIFHGWDTDYINRFVPDIKSLACNFDTKRLWLDDYRLFDEVLKRNVFSLPLFASL